MILKVKQLYGLHGHRSKENNILFQNIKINLAPS